VNGRLLAIYLRPAARLPVQSVPRAEADAGRGLRGDHAGGGRRQVTLLGIDNWRAACAEVGAELDPGLRRANLVLDGIDPGAMVGKVVAIGDVVIELLGELRPCELMDSGGRLGLCAALRPHRRGGAFGSIRSGGLLQVGDAVAVVSP
jgi:MOSC domain-containing protein YiiM